MTMQEIITTVIAIVTGSTFVSNILITIKNFRNNKNFQILEYQVDRLRDGSLDVKTFFEETIPAVKDLGVDIKGNLETFKDDFLESKDELVNELKETFNKELTALKGELTSILSLLQEHKLILKDQIKKTLIGGDDDVPEIPKET